VIRRNVRLAEGDAFNSAKLRRSRQLINNLGFFANVEVANEPGDGPDQTIVTVDVEEQSTGEVTFGGGYSTSDGPTGTVGIRERNLLGRAQDLGLNFTISGVTQQLDLSFTERYFLNRDVAAGFDVFRTSRDFQNTAFERQDLGMTLRTSYPIAERLAQNWRYTIKNEEIIPDGDASLSIRQQAGERLTSVIGQGLNYDGLDDRLNPTKGRFARWNVSYAGLGGDKNFLMNTIEGGQYIPFWGDWVLSGIVQGGYVFSTDDGPVLISDRFFIGSTTFRGFATGGLGPRDVINDDALGGNLFYTGTVELAFPLGLPNELGIRGRVFGVAGTLTDVDLSGLGIVDTGSLRSSVGVGVSWQSPFGPIRIDLSQAVLKESFDETEIVSFGFGSNF
jgi:outer membrane protein insertion porin family